jgi:oxygen-independent coproporphyrinogen III oxidase
MESTLAQTKPRTTSPSLGLYVHVPFCSTTCDFCAFYQTAPRAADMASFLGGIEAEAGLVTWDAPVSTVFWGGGTPGLLSPRQLAALAAAVRARAGAAVCEWSVEMAPASATEARLRVLRESGVTRISLGVQSFRPDRLEALGRRHTRAQALRAYERIRAAGFPSVNLDLMFALPGQDEAGWAADLDQAVALAPDHISTYCLTFEEDTALWLRLSGGRQKLDPEREARFYEAAWDRLGEAGYSQYEISNYARPGHACLHNLNTWRMGEWVGLGPSAASQHRGWRGANVADLGRWRRGVDEGGRMTEDRVELTPGLIAEDALIFGLRMNAGVDLGEWQSRIPGGPWEALRGRLGLLAEEGLVAWDGRRAALTRRGRLLADSVGSELILG